MKPQQGKVTNPAFIWRDFFKNDYMSFDDLVADKTLTIKEMEFKEIVGVGGKKDLKLLAYFKEKDVLPLIISKGKSKVISALHGSKSPADWVGKKITVFPDPSAKFRGEEVGGVGIRMVAPKSPSIQGERFETMLQAILDGNYTLGKALEAYSLTNEQETKIKDELAKQNDRNS